jgi:hypothetical protein
MLKKNLTPSDLLCRFGACPAVFELEDGQLVIVGKKPTGDLNQELSPLVGSDEYAIVISPALLANVAANAPQKQSS